MDDHWKKSSYSFSNGNCIEWRKSTYSAGAAECVEIAGPPVPVILVRDSQAKEGPVLHFTPAAWMKFVNDLK